MPKTKHLLLLIISILIFAGCAASDPTDLSQKLAFRQLTGQEIISYSKDTKVWEYPYHIVWKSHDGKNINVVIADQGQKKMILAINVDADAVVKRKPLLASELYEVIYKDSYGLNLAGSVQEITSLPGYGSNIIVLAEGHVGMALYELFTDEGKLMSEDYRYISAGLIEDAKDEKGKPIFFKKIKAVLETDDNSEKYMTVEEDGSFFIADSDKRPGMNQTIRIDAKVSVSKNIIYAIADDEKATVYEYVGMDTDIHAVWDKKQPAPESEEDESSIFKPNYYFQNVVRMETVSTELEVAESAYGSIKFMEQKRENGSVMAMKVIELRPSNPRN